MSNTHVDLNIVDGDFVTSPTLTVGKLSQANVVAQDIKHRILESGLLVKLIKLRNINYISAVLTELELEVEKDNRLVPGSVFIKRNDDQTLSINADTHLYGQVKLGIGQ